MKKIFIVLLVICASASSQAQDPNYSQFFNAPLTQNIANAGLIDSGYRMGMLIRQTQFSGTNPFTTGSVSLDSRAFAGHLPENDRFGIGAMGLYDQSNAGALKTSYFAVLLGYNKALSRNGKDRLGLGFQAGYTGRKVDNSKLSFEDQYSGDGFNTSLPSTGSVSNPSVHYFDFSSSILYTHKDESMDWYAGVSLFHINRPTENFGGGADERIEMRWNYHAGVTKHLTDEDDLMVLAQYQAKYEAHETTAGVLYGRKIDTERNILFQLGACWRWQDAIYPYVGLTYKKLRFGLSYDIPASSNAYTAVKRNSSELGLQWLF